MHVVLIILAIIGLLWALGSCITLAGLMMEAMWSGNLADAYQRKYGSSLGILMVIGFRIKTTLFWPLIGLAKFFRNVIRDIKEYRKNDKS